MTEPIAMTIRHMKIEDYPLVYELWIRCTGFTMRDIDDCKNAIKTFLERNPNTCFVAEDDGGRIIGAILAGHDGRRSRIYHTAVDPDARGRGIGSILVGRVVETLRAIGLPKVAVGVPSDNDAGNDFHTADKFCFLCQEQGNCSDPTVEIPYCLFPMKICVFQCLCIKLLGLHRIYLIERQR